MTKESFLESATEEMDETISSIQTEAQESFESGFSESRAELEDLADPEEVANVEFKWTIKHIWESAKTFGKFVGIEAGKGACFFGGMKISEKLYEVTSKNPAADENTKKAYEISSKLLEASSTIQQVSKTWQLWLANHYDNRDSYGSITAEDTTITRFQILQNKVSEMTKVQDEKVGPAITVASKQKTRESLKGLATAYKTMLDKAYLVSTDISTKEQLMVKDGLTDCKADLDKAKDDLDAAV